MRSKFVLAALSAGAMAVSASADVLSNWNLIVFNDLTSTQEVEGRTMVGRDLNTGASNYGTMLHRPSHLGVDVLIVGRNLNGGNVQMEAGNLRLGGTRTGNVNFNGGGVQINDPGAASIVSAARSEVQWISNHLAGLVATNTVSIPMGSPAPVNFSAVANVDGVAVFNVNGNQLFGNGFVQQFDIAMNSAASVIINVSGTSITHNQGNFLGGFNPANASKILWNFYEAETLNIERALYGAVLAPNAHLTNGNFIAGSVAVENFTQNGEIHLPTYNGYVPTPGALALLGVAGLFASRRRN
ncbi:MAG: choice-of-anchor A family protein [Phycisphaeraceae bacterium]|nr:choice-of-anchor A family protein [Phycisphaeraceae bacterium]MCW5768625.1 choice-of-anchor A family protein [Phycisphaeraceae bacterium]